MSYCRRLAPLARRALPAATALAAVLSGSGCETLVSDVATRIRYELLREHARLHASAADTASFVVRPDHWPDACPGDAGYRVRVLPYRGGKQVAVGDILIECKARGSYGTGFGNASIYVAGELVAEKRPDEDLRFMLRKQGARTEIVRIE